MLFKKFASTFHEFRIVRDPDLCIDCKVCIKQCSYEAHFWDTAREKVGHDSRKCVGCHRCATMCPTGALTIKFNDSDFRTNARWRPEFACSIYTQAESGGALRAGRCSPVDISVYWDKLLLDAGQVTNTSIDSLRESMEFKTFLGAKPDKVKFDDDRNSKLRTEQTSQIELAIPIIFAGISFGSINHNLHLAMAMAAKELGTVYNTGEGGLHKSLYEYGQWTIEHITPGRIDGHGDYLNAGVGIKLNEATEYRVPVAVKIATEHNVAAIASDVVRAGADILTIDGMKGGTGAVSFMTGDNAGIPIELALASVDQRLRDEGLRSKVSIIAGGGFRCSGDVLKAIALGADAVNIGTAALIAVGCTLCGRCYTGKCPWGIATNDKKLAKRQNPEVAAERLVNLVRGWSYEIEEMLCGMGLNSIESLRGNRDKLRAVGLTDAEMQILGVKHAGR